MDFAFIPSDHFKVRFPVHKDNCRVAQRNSTLLYKKQDIGAGI